MPKFRFEHTHNLSYGARDLTHDTLGRRRVDVYLTRIDTPGTRLETSGETWKPPEQRDQEIEALDERRAIKLQFVLPTWVDRETLQFYRPTDMIYDEQEANEAEELHAVVEAVKDALANHLKGSVTITQVEETDRGVEADWLRKHDFTEGGPGVFSKTYPGKTTFEELSVKQQGLYKLLMRYLEKTHPGAMAQKRPEPA